MLRDIKLPCDALTLRPAEVEPKSLRSRRVDTSSRRAKSLPDEKREFRIEGVDLVVRSAPAAGREVRIELPTQLGYDVSVSELDSQDDWIRMKLVTGGITVTGWVPSSKLSEVAQDGSGHGWGPGGCACGRWRPNPSRAAFVGEVFIDEGTRVFAEPAEHPWATVAGASKFKVWLEPGDDWARIIRVSGVWSYLCAGDNPDKVLRGAWVPRAAVRLPKTALAPAIPGRTVARAKWATPGCAQ